MKTIITGLLGLSLSVVLIACGHGWQHGQVPESKWDKDYADCVHQAESQSRNPRVTKDPAQNWGTYGEVRYLTDKCMEDKGYVQK